jgi:hypothetical protein
LHRLQDPASAQNLPRVRDGATLSMRMQPQTPIERRLVRKDRRGPGPGPPPPSVPVASASGVSCRARAGISGRRCSPRRPSASPRRAAAVVRRRRLAARPEPAAELARRDRRTGRRTRLRTSGRTARGRASSLPVHTRFSLREAAALRDAAQALTPAAVALDEQASLYWTPLRGELDAAARRRADAARGPRGATRGRPFGPRAAGPVSATHARFHRARNDGVIFVTVRAGGPFHAHASFAARSSCSACARGLRRQVPRRESHRQRSGDTERRRDREHGIREQRDRGARARPRASTRAPRTTNPTTGTSDPTAPGTDTGSFIVSRRTAASPASATRRQDCPSRREVHGGLGRARRALGHQHLRATDGRQPGRRPLRHRDGKYTGLDNCDVGLICLLTDDEGLGGACVEFCDSNSASAPRPAPSAWSTTTAPCRSAWSTATRSSRTVPKDRPATTRPATPSCASRRARCPARAGPARVHVHQPVSEGLVLRQPGRGRQLRRRVRLLHALLPGRRAATSRATRGRTASPFFVEGMAPPATRTSASARSPSERGRAHAHGAGRPGPLLAARAAARS